MSARERRGSDNLVATSASSSSAATALDEALLGSGGEGEGEAMFGGGGPDGPRTRVSFWLAVLSGLLGAFQFGYNTGVMNAPKEQMRTSFGVHDADLWDWQYTIIVSAFCVGGFVGAIAGGPLASRFGRRPAIVITGVLFTVSGIIEMTASNYERMSLGRLVVGVGSGIATTVVPAYLVEISPRDKRGFMGTLNQYCVTIAILVSTLLGFAISSTTWWLLFAFPAGLGLLQILAYPLLIETKSEPSSRHSGGGLADLEKDRLIRDGIESDGSGSGSGGGGSLVNLLKDPVDRRALLIASGLMACQQLSGINGIMYYSTSIFSAAGMKSPLLAACLVNGVNVLMTQASASAVDKHGRRVLMTIGLSGMLASALLLTLVMNLPNTALGGILTVVFTMAFVASFAVGPGPIPWYYVSELFDSASRPLAASAAGGFNWFCNFLVGISFLPMQGFLGKIILHDSSAGSRIVFVPFAFVLSACVIFISRCVPETKGRTVRQVRQEIAASLYQL